MYTDDPLLDFHRHDEEQESNLLRLPVCYICENPIQDEYMYLINDEPVCKSCLDEHYRKLVDDHV